MKRVRSTEKTRSIECDLAFKATMFLTGQAFSFGPFASKEKALSAEKDFLSEERVVRGRSKNAPTGLMVVLKFVRRGGYYPPVLFTEILPHFNKKASDGYSRPRRISAVPLGFITLLYAILQRKVVPDGAYRGSVSADLSSRSLSVAVFPYGLVFSGIFYFLLSAE
jgi:hypothetical protein